MITFTFIQIWNNCQVIVLYVVLLIFLFRDLIMIV